MELNEVEKIASRKRLNAEAEKLREKVSRETANIIKLKVAQDTAYWDLKEKLQQVESNHEKLQQNMVDVQMQHEAISGQYQEELRLRPDTLNKVTSTREMCGVLQDYSGRLRDTLRRCAADQTALAEAFQQSGHIVRELRARHDTDAERSRAHVAVLEEKVQLLSEHRGQLMQLLSAANQQADGQSTELRRELATAAARREELLHRNNELTRRLDQCAQDIGQKDEIITSLRTKMQQLESQVTETAANLARRDNHIRELQEENQSLKLAIDNQDQFTESICEEKNKYLEKIALMEEKHVALTKDLEQLKLITQETSTVNLRLCKEKEDLLQQVQDNLQKDEMIAGLRSEMKRLMQQLESQATDTAAVLDHRNNQIKDLLEENQRLKMAVSNQDQFTKSISKEKDVFQEKIALMTEKHGGLLKEMEQLKLHIEEMSNVNLILIKEKENLLQQVQENVQIIKNLERKVKNLELERSQIEDEKRNVLDQLKTIREQYNDKVTEVQKLSDLKEKLETEISDLKAAIKTQRDTSDKKNKEQTELIKAKDNELNSNANIINQLMSQLKTSSEMESKLEAALQKIKKEIEMERNLVKEKEKDMNEKILKLEVIIRDKEEELTKRISIMSELRRDKERLQDRIQTMQSTIDNIQKELTRRSPSPAAPRPQPELDDNAVMLTPTHRQTQLLSSSPHPPLTPLQLKAPRTQEPWTFTFSDSSMEGNNLDLLEMNRRFNALSRGKRLSPAQTAALRRRGGSAARAARPVRAALGSPRPNMSAPVEMTALNNDAQTFQARVTDQKNKDQNKFFKTKRLKQ